MRPFKAFFRSDALRATLCWLGAQYIRLVWKSGKWQILGDEIPRRYWDGGKPFILCFWHGRILMMPYCWNRDRTIHMLISNHPDGQIIARTVGHFGIRTLAGSTTRGGMAAMRAMLKSLERGEYVGITPDGPRGPRMRASAGIVNLARLSGAPVIPATFSISRNRLLASWDRFLVALPFGRGVVLWGNPIEISRDADEQTAEQARRDIENSLNHITAEADRLCGQTTVEPDRPAAGSPIA